MEERVLGKNLKISAVGLGCMKFSHAVCPVTAVEQNQAFLNLLNHMAEMKDATLAQISMAWMLCKNPCIVPIPGTRKQERLLENAGAAKIKLSAEEVTALDEALNHMEMSAVFGGSKIVK